MERVKKNNLIFFILLVSIAGQLNAQNSVVSLFDSDYKLADQYYQEKNYKNALKLYSASSKKRKSNNNVYLKIAQCYFHLKEYRKTIENYDVYAEQKDLPSSDLLNYAEASAALLNYKKATEAYKKYLQTDPKNELVIKKIWRLDNKQYLFEDSAHYALRAVAVNTASGEMCATPYQNGVVFMSDREIVKAVKNINASSATNRFYDLYFAGVKQDTSAISQPFRFDAASGFGKGLPSKFNVGPVAFFDKERQVAFIASSSSQNQKGQRTLGLYFAQKQNGKWRITSSFTHNSEEYSIYNATIDQSGKTIFFSSDKKGGFGGKDLYKSELVNGVWSTPINLGEEINTAKDESYPFLHNKQALYFSSNGLPGLGELDVFRTIVKPDGFDEPQNVGYPINSSKDDFGFVLDTLGTHGYLSSNRKNGGYDDDLYEFDMDLQTYPLTISGVIKYKEHTWSQDTELKIMPGTKISLVDNLRNVSVYDGVSDAKGNFSIVIPYFSKYFIRVLGEAGDEHRVSLEILKYRKELSSYEVVIIKDLFTK